MDWQAALDELKALRPQLQAHRGAYPKSCGGYCPSMEYHDDGPGSLLEKWDHDWFFNASVAAQLPEENSVALKECYKQAVCFFDKFDSEVDDSCRAAMEHGIDGDAIGMDCAKAKAMGWVDRLILEIEKVATSSVAVDAEQHIATHKTGIPIPQNTGERNRAQLTGGQLRALKIRFRWEKQGRKWTHSSAEEVARLVRDQEKCKMEADDVRSLFANIIKPAKIGDALRARFPDDPEFRK